MSSGRRRRSHDPVRGAYPRSWRVNGVLREIVAEEMERLADADERLRMLTVTDVDTSSDLRVARVYVGTLTGDAAEALEERRAHLQRAVGRQVRMKRTPRLVFTTDPAVEAGEKVDTILRRLRDPDDGAGTDR